MDVLINTARGQKTPQESIDLFLFGGLDRGALVGIFKQLAEKAPVEAKELANKIAEGVDYSAKLKRLAAELLSGVEKSKHIHTAEDVIAALGKFQKGSWIKMSFKKYLTVNAFRAAFSLGILGMSNKGLVKLDSADGYSILIRANGWHLIHSEGNCWLTVQQDLTDDLVKSFAGHIAQCVEKIELVRVLKIK